jgi:hypothetical protein
LRRTAILAIAFLVFVAAVSTVTTQVATGSTYFCPMHPDITSKTAGSCPKCGMAFVFGDPWNQREYRIALATVPSAPKAGQPTRFRFAVEDPDSKKTVTTFAVVHDKQFHLFVVSQDLEHFAHIHPEQQSDGAWVIDHTLPVAGNYRVFTDFMPLGGTPQVLASTVVTAGYTGDLASSVPTLAPDKASTKTVGETTVHLTPEPPEIVAGRATRLKYQLAVKGIPVTDLEPYLAAWGHTLILSEDAFEYVHAHPIEYLPTAEPNPHGGPTVTFEAIFPKPGRYRLWTQFKRRGEVSTASFTVEAKPASIAP